MAEHIIPQGSVYKGSADDFEDTCEPCEKDGNFVEAAGYCKNCDEYLCDVCMKHHCRPKPCRHHVLIDKQQRPKNKPKTSTVTLCTVSCDKHPLEFLKFYCKKHHVMGCADCIILKHKTCDVDYISTLSDGYNTSTHYKDICDKLDQLQTQVNKVLSDEEKTAKDADTSIKKAVINLKQYRQEMNTYLDKTEHELLAKHDEIAKANQFETKKVSDQMKAIQTKLTSLLKCLTSNMDNTANLFVLANESHTQLVILDNEMKTVKETQIKCVEFMKNASLIQELSEENSLGALQLSDVPISPTTKCKHIVDMIPKHIADISTDDHSDTKGSFITGMVNIHENTIACTDFFNNSVKLVDVQHGKLLSTVSVMDKPWDITSITHNTLAVTLTNIHEIQFLEVTNNNLTKKELIGVNGSCRGIDCMDDKLVVSYEKPQKVEILDFHGNVMKLVQTDTAGNSILKCPYYVVMSHDGECIYVSDNEYKSIIKLTLDGTVQATYKDSDLGYPKGMFVCQDGSVLVCSSTSVHVISEDCKKQKILINENDGIYLPSGICYIENKGIICLQKFNSRTESDVIQTYKLE